MPRLDPFEISQKFPKAFQLTALNFILNSSIPFSRGLGVKIVEISSNKVKIISPPKNRRKNHVGGAHACALAVLGEFPAGLLIAKKYSFKHYRILIRDLNIEYQKQGRGPLYSEAVPPNTWPTDNELAESSIQVQSNISNQAGDTVALCHTSWQVKPWDQVRKK